MYVKAKQINNEIMIIHLEKEQLKQARRDLLRDDVYIIFVDALRQYHQEGYTTLAPAELYLSAKSFVGDVLQLPDTIEGIADEMDDILDEADNKDEAMLIMMVATGVFCAVGKKYKGFDADAVIMIIFNRWGDHPLFFPMLDICAKKEQKKWLEGKKTNLLTCELESMKTDGTTEAEAKDFLHPFLQQVCAYPDETIERVLNPLRDLNEMHSGMFDEEVNMLKRKLGVRNYNPTASVFPFINDSKNADLILSKIKKYQSGKTKAKDLAMPVRAAIDAGAIRRPTFCEYDDVEGFAKIPKSSLSDYTKPDLHPYDGAAYDNIVKEFKNIV